MKKFYSMSLLAFLGAGVLFPVTARSQDIPIEFALELLALIGLLYAIPVITPIYFILYAVLWILSYQRDLNTRPSFWPVIFYLPALCLYFFCILSIKNKHIMNSPVFAYSTIISPILFIFCFWSLYRDVKRFRRATAKARKSIDRKE